MESKLTKLLAPLEKDEQSLMKLDAIFAVSVCYCLKRIIWNIIGVALLHFFLAFKNLDCTVKCKIKINHILLLVTCHIII